MLLALVGPPGHGYRMNEAFGVCVSELEAQGRLVDSDSGAPTAEYVACSEVCESNPSRLVLLGRWVHVHVAYDDGAVCSVPELGDIFLP